MIRFVLRAAVLFSLLFLATLPRPEPAGAIFHLAVIDEVMSGVNGDPDVQYVEVIMLFSGQHIVHDTLLSVFDEDHDPVLDVLLILPNDVENDGTGVRWIMATQAFADLTGMTPDFIIPPRIISPNGMVCWGAPDFAPPPDEWPGDDPDTPEEDGYGFPFLYTDCVSYGGYTGPPGPLHPPATELSPGDGVQSLQRIEPITEASSLESGTVEALHVGGPPDAEGFALRCATPENNAGQRILLGPDDDGDGLPNCHEEELGSDPTVVDSDQDGCSDGAEVGDDVTVGGGRDPTNFWDFYDPNLDGSVSVLDFFALLQRFAAVGDPNIDPLSAPPDPPEYHPRFDRSAVEEKLSGPADGAIALPDFLLLLAQFGNVCA